MNLMKRISLAVVAAAALMAAAAGNASATILEIGGTAQSGAVAITASAESSIVLADTERVTWETCSVSSVAGTTSVFTGEKVTGNLSELSFTTCIRSPVTVDVKGGLYIIHEAGTTSASVFSEGASVTVPTSFGPSVTCTTLASGTRIGTLTGVASGNATMSISAVLSCGFLLPSMSWSGTYRVTSPAGLGVANGTTTLEIGGVVQNKAVAIAASAESSITLSDTEKAQANTCSVSSAGGTTSTFSGVKVTGSLSELSFSTCTRNPVTVDLRGGLYIEHESGTTSGSVFSEGASVTVPTTFGFSVTCTTTSTGTPIGTLTGTASSSAHATMSISAVLSCGFLLPSASWSGTYKVTSPTGLGVTS